MSKPVPRVPGKAVDLFEAQLEKHPKIERKGANNPYTSVNGNMFSHVNKDGEVGLRLSKEDRERFIEEHDSAPLTSYGAVMREYVVVPESVLENERLFQSYLDKSFEYACSLKPKPTKKNK